MPRVRTATGVLRSAGDPHDEVWYAHVVDETRGTIRIKVQNRVGVGRRPVLEEPRTGWTVASDAGYSVALGVTIDRALRLEGLARELVRALNDLRRRLDPAIDRRITLRIDVDGDLAAAVDAHREAIAADVLAVDVEVGGMDVGTEITSPANRCASPSNPSNRRRHHLIAATASDCPDKRSRQLGVCPSPRRTSNVRRPVLFSVRGADKGLVVGPVRATMR